MSAEISVAALAIVRADGRVLTVRKRGTTAYMLPGGKPEPGESRVVTARREVAEELGIEVPAREMTLMGTFSTRAANEAGTRLHATVFRVAFSAIVGVPQPRAEIADARWVDPAIDDAREAPLNREWIFPLLARG